ncbi:MAG: HEAT repeat domain-containing protein [Elusimicrobia bacterium]|nr:HEAT repeat domain-containing protein [Elusimicrobiota bacterium]
MVVLAALAVVVTGAHAAASASAAALDRQARAFLADRSADSDPEVRSAVAAALGDIGESTPKTLELLKKAGRDPDVNVRLEAGYSLFRLGDEGGSRLLMDIVLSSAAPASRGQAIIRLSDMATEEAASLMERTLADASAEVRDATAVALCRLDLAQHPAAAGFLRRSLEAARDKDAVVRAAAVKALGQTNLASVREALVAAAGDDDAAVRAEAVAALAASADEDLAKLFTERLHDPDPRVRALAAAGLAASGQSVDLGLAERRLREGGAEERLLALKAAAAAPGEPALKLLARAMAEDASLKVRVAAAAMLAKRLQRRGR